MDGQVQAYNNVFNELQQKFVIRAAGDTLVVVHRIWKGVEDMGKDLQDLGNDIWEWSYHANVDA